MTSSNLCNICMHVTALLPLSVRCHFIHIIMQFCACRHQRHTPLPASLIFSFDCTYLMTAGYGIVNLFLCLLSAVSFANNTCGQSNVAVCYNVTVLVM